MATITVTLEIPATVTKEVAGHTFEIDMAKVPAVSLAWALRYGLRGLNDVANSAKFIACGGKGAPNKDKWTLADSRSYVDSFLDGSIAERSRRSAGTSVVDPVAVEARKLALDDILAKIGAKNWAEAAKNEIGARFISATVSAKSGNEYLRTNDEAIDAFIEKNAARDYKGRAKAIVDARAKVAAEDDIAF